MGGRGSGVSFHTHGAAMAETIHGLKRWFISPPDLRPHFDPDESQLAWVLRRESRGGLGAAAGAAGRGALLGQGVAEDGDILECTAHEGDVVYVPPMFWHATLNLADYSFFVSTFTQEHRNGSTAAAAAALGARGPAGEGAAPGA